MRAADVREKLSRRLDELQDLGVGSLYVFGSVARGEARPDSDIDFLVEFARPTGLLGLTRLRLWLEQVFQRPVDLGTKDGLRPSIRQHALAEAVRVA
ncbi:MAG: nucleotidyltransferase family protein [Planctomycetes bacterium]|nr:nucleotidyltransferase family protein [Planctomycetota bacterium]